MIFNLAAELVQLPLGEGMNLPSRRMPPSEVRKVLPMGCLTLGILLVAVVVVSIYFITKSVAVPSILGGFFAFYAVLTIFHHRRLRRIQEERKGESIGTFARALPARAHDTWVVRAVYEEMSRVVGAPLRPTDEVWKFWNVDPEEFDDIILVIGYRARRSMEDIRPNPLFRRIVTIADVITFFEHQPKLPTPTNTEHLNSPPTDSKVPDFSRGLVIVMLVLLGTFGWVVYNMRRP